MWTCPRCSQKFVNRNQWHSCNQGTIDDFLAGRSDEAVRLFHFLLDEFNKLGVFELHPAKTRVALVGRMRFASINRIGRDFVDGHIVLDKSRADETCFYRIDQFGPRAFVHNFRIYKRSDISRKLRKYMKMAVAIGQRTHIRPASKPDS